MTHFGSHFFIGLLGFLNSTSLRRRVLAAALAAGCMPAMAQLAIKLRYNDVASTLRAANILLASRMMVERRSDADGFRARGVNA